MNEIKLRKKLSVVESGPLGKLAYEQIKAESLANRDFGNKVVRPREFLERVASNYRDSRIVKKCLRSLGAGRRPVVLFTDFDNTFQHKAKFEESQLLKKVLDDANIGIAYITLRRKLHVRKGDVPKPDILSQGDGTEIQINKNGNFFVDHEYESLMSKEWDKKKILQKMQFVARQLSKSDVITFPPQTSNFMLVAYVEGSKNFADEYREALLKQVRDQDGIDVSSGIWKSTSAPHLYYVNVIPSNGGKLAVVTYLTKQLGIGDGIVAGDASTDLEMLEKSPFPAILVGGSEEDARARLFSISRPEWGAIRRMDKDGKPFYVGGQIRPDDVGPATLIQALQSGFINPEAVREFWYSLYRLTHPSAMIQSHPRT